VVVRGVALAFALACTIPLSAGQATGVLQITIALPDPVRGVTPVSRHALLISDNPATSEPRRVLTAADGTVVVKLRPGNYTVESDRPVALQGKAYRWTQMIDIVDGRTVTLAFTAANAEVEAVTTETAAAADATPAASDPSFLLTQKQDGVVALWTPTMLASGSLIDARGLIVTARRAIGNASRVDAQLSPAVKVAATVLVSDEASDVAVLRIAPSAQMPLRPLALDCSQPASSTVVNGQEVFTIGVPVRGGKVLESGTTNRVTARTMAADFELPFGGAGGPVLTAGGEMIGVASLPDERDDSLHPDSRIIRRDPVCEAIANAAKLMTTAPSPSEATLPVDPPQPSSLDRLRQAAERRTAGVMPYMITASDFEVAVITPVLALAAQNSSGRTTSASLAKEAATMGAGALIRPLIDFANWSEYVADFPPVLLIRVTPRFVEGFWTKIARTAAQTQGMALPPIKRFASGFSRMRAFCGEAEITPIHPFILVHRLSETEAISEGLYAFDPASLGPSCKTVRIDLYSEKAPEKADSRTLDAKLLEQIQQDFTEAR
jgi:S1-C subfamily serine protease